MCIFFCTSDTAYWENSYLAMLERIFQYSPVATLALCSPYFRHSHFFLKIRLNLLQYIPQPTCE